MQSPDPCSMRRPIPEDAVLGYVAPRLRSPLCRMVGGAPWLEVRIAAGRPVCVRTVGGDLWPDAAGRPGPPERALVATPEDIDRTVQLVTRGSVYAWEEELGRGFCTLPGGHRVGLAGRIRWGNGAVAGQKDFGSVNLRVARAVLGCAAGVLRSVVGPGGVRSTLVYGAPGSGKTTLLRDLARLLSTGEAGRGWRVVIADERSELAAAVGGEPQFDVGPRTDVLDGAPKHVALPMLIRSMGPEVAICDEIGGPLDASALEEAARSGVAVIASAHAGSLEDLAARPSLALALRSGAFAVGVGLGPDRTVREVRVLP